MTIDTIGLIPRVGGDMAVPALELASPGFPGFPGIRGIFIVAITAVHFPVFACQVKSRFGMVEIPVTVHTGGTHGFIFEGLFYFSCRGDAHTGMAFQAFHFFMKQC